MTDDVKMSSEQSNNSYNLRPQNKQNVKWPNYPVHVDQSEFSIANL